MTPTMEAARVMLCRRDALREGEARGFDPLGEGRDTLFVVRRGEVLRAFRDTCPHWPGTPMAWRKNAYLNADGSRIVCHAHGAQFDIDSGLCVLGPCAGQSLQALPLEIDADGFLHVVLDEPNASSPRTRGSMRPSVHLDSRFRGNDGASLKEERLS